MDIVAVKNNDNVQKNPQKEGGNTDTQKIYVYKDGAVTEGFDPTIASKTCQAAPTQIKIFDSSSAVEVNSEKKVF